MIPIVLALAVVGPAAYAISGLVSLNQNPPYSRRKRRAAVWRIRLGLWATVVAMVFTMIWMR